MTTVPIQNAVLPALFSGGSTRTLGSKLKDWVSMMDFGAVPNDSSSPARTANAAAFAAAHNYFGTIYSDHAKGGTILLPPGNVYFTASPLVIAKSCKIVGYGGCEHGAQAGTTLWFPGNTHGIRIHSNNTAPIDNSYDAEGTTFYDFNLNCEDNGSTSGHGIWNNSNVFHTFNVYVFNFAENGWNVVGSGGAYDPSNPLRGNPNQCHIMNCGAQGNGGKGLYIAGGDANASLVTKFNARQNSGWGIHNVTNYQNTFVACHLNGNGTTGANGSGNIKDDSGCVFIDTYVEGSAHNGIELAPASLVIGGLLASMVPDSNYPWLTVSGDGSGAECTAFDAAGVITKVLPLAFGSGYTTATVSVAEHGSGSGLAVTANIVGGQITSYNVTNGGSLYNTGGRLACVMHTTSSGGVRMSGVSSSMSDSSTDRKLTTALSRPNEFLNMVALGDNSNGLRWKWENSDKVYALYHNNQPIISVVNDLSTLSGSLITGAIGFPYGLWLGEKNTPLSTLRRHVYASAMPTSGSWRAGEIVWNTDPAKDGSNMVILGWSRLTTGSAHVSGTDWAICNVSHVSPAT